MSERDLLTLLKSNVNTGLSNTNESDHQVMLPGNSGISRIPYDAPLSHASTNYSKGIQKDSAVKMEPESPQDEIFEDLLSVLSDMENEKANFGYSSKLTPPPSPDYNLTLLPARSTNSPVNPTFLNYSTPTQHNNDFTALTNYLTGYQNYNEPSFSQTAIQPVSSSIQGNHAFQNTQNTITNTELANQYTNLVTVI